MSVSRKIAIVTGANKGIGYAIVRNLILRSSSPLLVYAAARDPARGTKAVQDLHAESPVSAALKQKSSEIKFLQLDIASHESIQKFKEQIQSEHGEASVSILINNAAVAPPGSTNKADVGIAKETLGINYWGTKDFTQAMIPLIKKDGEGKIINLASTEGRLAVLTSSALEKQFTDKDLTYERLDGLMQKFIDDIGSGEHKKEGWPTNSYQVSKVGVIALTKIQARENPGYLINAVCPGWIKTDLGGSYAPGTIDQGSETPVYMALEDLKGVSGEFWKNDKIHQW